MMRAYSQLYLSKASRAVGAMLHDAVIELGLDGADFLRLFVQSGVAGQFESGNPKFIAGKSGLELYFDVVEKTSGGTPNVTVIESFERSIVYWAGWMLAQYQWYSNRSFKNILDTVPYDEFIALYKTLHEADIQKGYEVLDAHFSDSVSRLKIARRCCGMTQKTLADESGVSINTIRAYERKSKDLNKAQFDTVIRLADTLKCNVAELFD